jgi:hypothetical protein
MFLKFIKHVWVGQWGSLAGRDFRDLIGGEAGQIAGSCISPVQGCSCLLMAQGRAVWGSSALKCCDAQPFDPYRRATND